MDVPKQEVDSAGKRKVYAPDTGCQTTSGINSVFIAEDEEVDWHIQYNPDGSSIVSGFTIRKKANQNDNNFEQPLPFEVLLTGGL